MILDNMYRPFNHALMRVLQANNCKDLMCLLLVVSVGVPMIPRLSASPGLFRSHVGATWNHAGHVIIIL
jgi:hypothetical protein